MPRMISGRSLRPLDSRTLAVALVTAFALLATSCAGGSSSSSDPSARYFPNTQPTPNSPVPDDVSNDLGAAPASLGPVARPNQRLTPGAVAMHDLTAICQQPKRTRAPITYAQQLSVLNEYRIASWNAGSYGLDYLVPLQLGGSAVIENIWPAAVTGVGFHEKEQLNYRMRLLVCQGGMPLGDAQREIASDWYSLWVKYATPGDVATASAS